MKISRLDIKNYRSISTLQLEFPTYYSAISGKNDAGKTNVLTAIRGMFEGESPFYYNEEISLKDDLPKWITKDSKERSITIEAELLVFKDSDAGLYAFLTDYLALGEPGQHLTVRIKLTVSSDYPDGVEGLEVDGKTYERLKAQEVLNKLQSSRTFLFHDSTEFIHRATHYPRFAGLLFGQLAGTDSEKLEGAKAKLNTTLSTITKRQQKDISELLGRLKDKYKVGISLKQAFDPEYLPFSVTLGVEGVNVELENWGSGTQNRTWILLMLFKARRTSHSETSASKITPILVIEEPESFLHPSAQAEFGKVIQDLAEEFQVQVIVATHSPYMLSQDKPESNILLERNVEKNRVRETVRIDTSSDCWMAPFALALGLDNDQFAPWRKAVFSAHESILMVEGDTDKEYFEMLRSETHGDRRLRFTGEIFAYGGKDTLKHRILLQFIRSRYKRCFITYDLDADQELSEYLSSLGLQKGKDYCVIGVESPGKRAIEGLLPDRIHAAVYGCNAALVQQAAHGTKQEKQSAVNQLKKLYLEEFKKVAQPGDEFYKGFYGLVRMIDKCLCA